MIAIIETGGKQYLVTPNQKITTEKAGADAGAALTFDKVLLVADENGNAVQIGTPTISASVAGTLVRNFRTRKIMVRKFKNKVRYRRTAGHRQHKTEVSITAIK